MHSQTGSDRGHARALAALRDDDRRVLALMALVAEPLSLSGWGRWLVAAGIRGPRGHSYSALDLEAVASRLVQSGFVLELSSPQRSRPDYAVAPPRRHRVLDGARRDGTLDPVYQKLARYQSTLDDADHNPAPQVARTALALVHGCKVSPANLTVKHAGLARELGMALASMLGPDAPLEGVLKLPEALRHDYLRELSARALLAFIPASPELEAHALADDATPAEVRATFALARIARGAAASVEPLLAGSSGAPFAAARALAHLEARRFEDARREAWSALDGGGKTGVLGLLACLIATADPRGEGTRAGPALTALAAADSEVTRQGVAALQAFQALLHEDAWPFLSAEGAPVCTAMPDTWLDALCWGFAARAGHATFEPAAKQRYLALLERTQQASPWLGAELRALIDGTGDGKTALTKMYAPEPPWKGALAKLEDALAEPGAPEGAEAPVGQTERLAWCLTVDEGVPALGARLQTLGPKGFSGGRRLPLATLPELRERIDLATEQDRSVIQALLSPPGAPSEGPPFENERRAMLALAGHPHVFGDPDAREPVEVVLGAPRFNVRSEGDLLRITVEPRECVRGALHAVRDGSRVTLTRFDARQQAIAQNLSGGELTVPKSAEARVARLVAGAATSFTVSSDVGAELGAIARVPADSRVHVAVSRRVRGLGLRLWARPLPLGPHCPLGQGPKYVLAPQTGAGRAGHVQAERDFEAEQAAFDQLRAEVPALERAVSGEEFGMDDPAASLELLHELRVLGDRIVVEWTDARRMQVVTERATLNMKLSLANADYWLSADGELTVDDDLKLSLGELLELYQRAEGRFVPLDEERYLMLDESLQRQLEELDRFAQHEGERVRVHPLALPAWASDGDMVSFDAGVERRLVEIREASTLAPEVPRTLQTELRPYQLEGFTWMRRLAHWGAGICLADDMGLGKTLQTLALLLDYAASGPSLVVAPMSVCRNWIDETGKFAPSLRVVSLGTERRESTLAGLGAGDLLVCSYGVMQQEIEALAAVRFQVLVLDEAQAIKNAATQRARAALQLSGSVRVALSGTPVENHLGEIWSLMNFLNPGLLGSASEFEQRFARPIQRDGDGRQAEVLRQIIRPFVLRRRKQQVLTELPDKTEITLEIEPSKEELALFEALRTQARARMADAGKPNEIRFALLAEITRMRRAACHPDLVAPEAKLASSKLAAFEALVAELREGGHRALVFSQFVDYLSLVRARLDALEIPYQYLDGRSTAKKRADAVRKFQAGEGDLFLISLKAGGFGLNLTAADYVIHLDPWWNPAVEDQASDRAHRIGQTRPVTVYRLVMRSTLEQKILGLHETKREVADQLLAGTERGDKLDIEDLLALLNGP